MAADLGVGPGVLKQGAKDIVEILKPVKKVDLGDAADVATKVGNDDAAASLVTFCATWESGASSWPTARRLWRTDWIRPTVTTGTRTRPSATP